MENLNQGGFRGHHLGGRKERNLDLGGRWQLHLNPGPGLEGKNPKKKLFRLVQQDDSRIQRLVGSE